MDIYLDKKYKLKSSENFDEYLKLVDLGIIWRKVAANMSPVIMLTRNEDLSYSLIFLHPIRKIVINFIDGEEFIEERAADGYKTKTVISIEGNKLIHVQIHKNGKKSVHVTEFSNDTLTVTTRHEGWENTSTRTYERISE